MAINFTFLSVARLIIHEVPRRISQDDPSTPTLSEVESDLTSPIKGMLRDRLMSAADTSPKGFDIEKNPTSSSPVPPLIQSYLARPNASLFVEMSQKMANHLFQCQPSVSPAGLLAVMECSFDGHSALAILKIEKEEGARLFKSQGGKVTFNLEHFQDLVLTPKTKVFKLAVVARDVDTFYGRACDNQRGYTNYKAVADFFLDRFLGCRLAELPPVSTKKFYENTALFLHERYGSDPERYSQIYTHLISSLTSQKKTLSVKKFAEDYIPTGDRDSYIEFHQERGTGLGSFDVDLKFIESRLKKTHYAFASGTSLTVPNENVIERIKMKKQKNGEVKVEFTDRLVGLKG